MVHGLVRGQMGPMRLHLATMARASKKSKRQTLARKKRCFFHCLFHFKLSLRSRLVLGFQLINWSEKIGKLMQSQARCI